MPHQTPHPHANTPVIPKAGTQKAADKSAKKATPKSEAPMLDFSAFLAANSSSDGEAQQ